MEDATGTSRLNPMGQGVAAVKGIAAAHPAIQLLQTSAGGNAAKGREATTMNDFFAWEKVHLSLKLVLGHEGRLNPSCWGHEHSCEAKTRWKTQTTAFCLAAGYRSPNSSCVPGRQRGPGAGAAGCAVGEGPREGASRKATAWRCRGAPSAAEPAGCAGAPRYPRPATPPGPPRVNNTFTHVNTPGRDFVANLCRQRLNLT